MKDEYEERSNTHGLFVLKNLHACSKSDTGYSKNKMFIDITFFAKDLSETAAESLMKINNTQVDVSKAE